MFLSINLVRGMFIASHPVKTPYFALAGLSHARLLDLLGFCCKAQLETTRTPLVVAATMRSILLEGVDLAEICRESGGYRWRR